MLNQAAIRRQLLAFAVNAKIDNDDYVVTGHAALALQDAGGVTEAETISIALAPDIYKNLAANDATLLADSEDKYNVIVLNEASTYYYNAGNVIGGLNCQRPYNVWSAYKDDVEHKKIVMRLEQQLRIA